MRFADIAQQLEKFISFVRNAIIAVTMIEAILVILIGIASGNLNNSNTFWIWLLVLCAGAYLFLLALKAFYNRTFPGSIVNELKSERELTALKRNSERQNTISDFLVTVMGKLNGQTCALNYGDDTHLCDKGIKDGIYTLVQPVIDNIYFILDTINTQFTTGIYLDCYCVLDGDEDQGIIPINDQLTKEGVLQKDLLTQMDASGEQLSIQTAIRACFNNKEFVKKDYSTPDGAFTIICSPIPVACNEIELDGVFFIISKVINSLPVDTELNLRIFNRVISNWLYRYNECISQRNRMKAQQAPIQAAIRE